MVLSHDLRDHNAPSNLEHISALLRKKEPPILKGLLVHKKLGNKYLLLKPHLDNKAITVSSNANSEKQNDPTMTISKGIKSNDKKLTDQSDVPRSRKKRFVFSSLRNIAVPISIFHYLGFLPMRVPGLPFHIDPGLPDYTVYEPYNEIHYPEEPIRNRSIYNKRKKKQKKY